MPPLSHVHQLRSPTNPDTLNVSHTMSHGAGTVTGASKVAVGTKGASTSPSSLSPDADRTDHLTGVATKGVSASKMKVILPFASALQTMRLLTRSMGDTLTPWASWHSEADVNFPMPPTRARDTGAPVASRTATRKRPARTLLGSCVPSTLSTPKRIHVVQAGCQLCGSTNWHAPGT
jgi:hypothetical protein